MTKQPKVSGVSRFVWILLVIAALALVGRVAYVLAITQHDDHFYDSTAYLLVSESVVDGDGLEFLGQPYAGQPPMTVFAITPATAIFGLDMPAAIPQRLTMAILGALGVVVIGLLGRAVAGDRVGLLTAAIAAIYPNLWISNGIVMADTLAVLSVALALLFTYRLLRAPGWGNAAALGLICGLCVLTRGELTLFIPMLAAPAVLLAKGATWRSRFAWGAIVIAVFTVTVAPWIIRNMTTFAEPTYLATDDGGTLLGANCDRSYGGEGIGLWNTECTIAVEESKDPAVMATRQRDAALDYIGDHLDRAPLVAAVRVARVWELYRPLQGARLGEREGRTIEVGWAGLVMYYVLLPFAVAGVIVLHRRRTTWWPLAIPFAIVTLTVAFLAYGYVRFRAPAEVSLVVLAAVSADALFRWTRQRRAAPAQVDEGSPVGT